MVRQHPIPVFPITRKIPGTTSSLSPSATQKLGAPSEVPPTSLRNVSGSLTSICTVPWVCHRGESVMSLPVPDKSDPTFSPPPASRTPPLVSVSSVVQLHHFSHHLPEPLSSCVKPGITIRPTCQKGTVRPHSTLSIGSVTLSETTTDNETNFIIG